VALRSPKQSSTRQTVAGGVEPGQYDGDSLRRSLKICEGSCARRRDRHKSVNSWIWANCYTWSLLTTRVLTFLGADFHHHLRKTRDILCTICAQPILVVVCKNLSISYVSELGSAVLVNQNVVAFATGGGSRKSNNRVVRKKNGG
jgi:hypothetical protein